MSIFGDKAQAIISLMEARGVSFYDQAQKDATEASMRDIAEGLSGYTDGTGLYTAVHPGAGYADEVDAAQGLAGVRFSAGADTEWVFPLPSLINWDKESDIQLRCWASAVVSDNYIMRAELLRVFNNSNVPPSPVSLGIRPMIPNAGRIIMSNNTTFTVNRDVIISYVPTGAPLHIRIYRQGASDGIPDDLWIHKVMVAYKGIWEEGG